MKRLLKLKKFQFAAGAVFAVLSGILFYILADTETITLDNRERQRVGGTYVKLEDGVTHYILDTQKDAHQVVLLHGSTVSIWDFDLQVPVLLKNGFTVLRYDTFGRGFSDRPDISYTRRVYRKQLLQLLDMLHVHEKVILAGHSLGGATAVSFAAEYPERVAGIFLVSPVIDSVTSAAPFIICNTPLAGPLIYRAGMVRFLRKRALAQWSGNVSNPLHYDKLFVKQTEIKGFEHAVCSMFRTDLVGNYLDEYRKVGKSHIPVQIVYGENDKVIGLDNIDKLKKMNNGFVFTAIKNAGHSAHVEQKDVVNSIMVKFMEKNFK
jgi:pimeloyl-ACP methyl ester carboxylesterase